MNTFKTVRWCYKHNAPDKYYVFLGTDRVVRILNGFKHYTVYFDDGKMDVLHETEKLQVMSK